MSTTSPPRTMSGRPIVIFILIFTAIVVSIAAVMLFGHPRGKAAPPPSIAVLPFVDLSPAHDQQYLSDGVTGQIIDSLSRIPDFQVVARGSVFALKDKPEPHDIGERFNVRSVLQGTVQRSGSRVHVTAKLINAADEFQLWSQSYDREMKDIFALEDEIPRSIVSTLGLNLAQPLPPAPRADLEAYNLYLEGRYSYFKWQPDDVHRSIAFFEQAIDKDPHYALAYAGLADSYAWPGFFRDGSPDVMREAMPKARAAADHAIELDPRLDSAYVARGEVESLYDYDWDAAHRDYAHASSLNPFSGNAMVSEALTYYAPLGRTKEAIEEMKRAQKLDPLSPVTNTYLGVAYFLDRQYDAAIAQFKKTIEMSPDFHEPHAMLLDAYIASGRTAEARAAGVETIDEAQLLAREGNPEKARQMLRELARKPQNPMKLACAYFAAGDAEAGFKELDHAYREHDGMLAFAKVWPELDSVRSDARFQSLLEKMHLK
jgi:adenylate cyclase